ncbi:hypothetical protein IPA_04185 [Ignicoccus pacificus DSM 13166]|uniref:Uncharacterized protein n=1 Tax=Ignicoccus pacificus DSM 13166 TaxID=940294 RepID=A0A977KCQ8_9CREN|nr:hypothetical protein IPA_04185 [Ignicoccus pacificus DSM 13166]
MVDSETGVVVDIIVDEGPYLGNSEPKPYIGTSQGDDGTGTTSLRIQKSLKKRLLIDRRGTYVAYKMGLTSKSVGSLTKVKKIERIRYKIQELESAEFLIERDRWMKIINQDARLASRTERVKLALASVMAARSLGLDISLETIAKIYKVNEHHLRKLVSLTYKRIGLTA